MIEENNEAKRLAAFKWQQQQTD